jgi:hypothetical protein
MLVDCVACINNEELGALWERNDVWPCSRCMCAQSNIVSTEIDQVHVYVSKIVKS